MYLMKKRKVRSSYMLPIDERLVPDIISFSHIKGVARVFLTLEIFLSILVVAGTASLAIFHCFS
jgi:hypothetical protein